MSAHRIGERLGEEERPVGDTVGGNVQAPHVAGQADVTPAPNNASAQNPATLEHGWPRTASSPGVSKQPPPSDPSDAARDARE